MLKRSGRIIVCPATALLLAFPAAAQQDGSGLTRAKFVRDCLMCHGRAAPEGVSKDILAGLHPEPGLRPADAMPGIQCWRRCEHCSTPAPSAHLTRSP